MQACDGAIVFDAEVKGAAFGVGEANYSGDQIRIGEAFSVAFEFNGEGFLGGDGAHGMDGWVKVRR